MSQGLLLGVGGGSSAFSPASITGLQLWLDAHDAATLWQDDAGTTPATADGDPIGRWSDKSGNGNHFYQGTGSNKPTLRKAAQNSKDVLEFDGVDDWLRATAALNALTAGTAFVVVKANLDPAAATASSALWHFGAVASATHYPWTDGVIYEQFGTDTRKTVGNPTPALTTCRVYAVVSAAGNFTVYLDGVQIYTTGTNTVSFNSSASATRLGSNSDATAVHAGRIAELLLYNSALGSTDRAAVQAYLAAKWGTTP